MASPLRFDSNVPAKRDPGWVSRLFSRQSFSPHLQELKFKLHKELIGRVNLEALSSLPEPQIRAEIRQAVEKLVDEQDVPLTMQDRERVCSEVLDEVFGLGPLEPLLEDHTISDILVTTPRLVYVERAGKLYRTPVEFKDNQHLLRIIEKIVSGVGHRIDES